MKLYIWLNLKIFCISLFHREEYYQEGDHVHPRLKALKAYRKALATWGRWVDRHIDYKKTLVFFRGYSGTHFRYRLTGLCLTLMLNSFFRMWIIWYFSSQASDIYAVQFACLHVFNVLARVEIVILIFDKQEIVIRSYWSQILNSQMFGQRLRSQGPGIVCSVLSLFCSLWCSYSLQIIGKWSIIWCSYKFSTQKYGMCKYLC